MYFHDGNGFFITELIKSEFFCLKIFDLEKKNSNYIS